MNELKKELQHKLEIAFGYQIGKEVILSVHQVGKENGKHEVDIDGIFQYINHFIETNFVPKSEWANEKAKTLVSLAQERTRILAIIHEEDYKFDCAYVYPLIENIKSRVLNGIDNPFEQLKAENEKLGKVVSESAKLLTDNIIDVAQARKETKEAIKKVLMKRLMDGSIDFIKINATRLSKEFDEAIEPQQNSTVAKNATVSCKECEHEHKYYNGIATNGICLKCNGYSLFQPKPKEK